MNTKKIAKSLMKIAKELSAATPVFDNSRKVIELNPNKDKKRQIEDAIKDGNNIYFDYLSKDGKNFSSYVVQPDSIKGNNVACITEKGWRMYALDKINYVSPIKVGDIYMWLRNANQSLQTCHYYEVIGVDRLDIELREIKAKPIPGGNSFVWEEVPIKGEFEPKSKPFITKDNGKGIINFMPWDGKPHKEDHAGW